MKTMKFKRTMLVLTLLVMTLSAVTGGTIAWFTDSVESVNNIIESGNLDIEVYVDEAIEANKVGKKEIFDKPDLWEPGAVATAKLIVKNEGNLALKYQMTVSSKAENDLEGHKLSEVLKVAFVTDDLTGKSREDVIKAAQAANPTAFADFNKTGNLLAGATDALDEGTLVVYWLPSANDNDYNVNNGKTTSDGKPLSITIGLNVEATQDTVEVDSFGDNPYYDENANYQYEDNGLIFVKDLTTNELWLKKVTENFVGTEVTVPAGVTGLMGGAFSSNSNIKTVYVPASVVDFGATGVTTTNASSGAFKGSSVEKVVLADGIKAIPHAAFNGANNLKSVNIPTSVEFIGINAFRLTALTELTVPATVKTISYGAFRDMGSLTTATIEGDEVYIPDYAFRQCVNLKSVYLKVNKLTLGTNMIFTTSSSNNENPNGITVYVYNQQVKDTLDNNANFNGEAVLLVPKTVKDSAELVEAIKNAVPGSELILEAGEYAVSFTNNTSFNVDGLTITGKDGAKLSVSSSEVWYGRVQGSGVTFENIHFTSSVGATGKATYNNCTFDDWAICASSNKEETYFNNCTINGTLNTSTDFSSGDVYVKDSTIAKADYSGSATMYFENCTIGELISYNMATELKNCTVTTLDDTHMTSNKINVK